VTKDELIEALDALEANAAWPLIVDFVAEWIEAQGQVHHTILPIEGSSLALKWREEMG
jgi:hypothetical protein